MMLIKKILVPTDFSESATPAYIHAQEIAQKFGARIDFMHVVPNLQYFNESMATMSHQEVPVNLDEDIYPTAQQKSDHQLKEVAKDYVKDEYKGEMITKINRKPSSAIAEVAKDGNYDLIVMASKGSHDSDMFRGSTTEKVIRHSEVPVFTVDKGLTAEGIKRILLPTDGSEISFTALPLALTLAEIYGADITLYHVLELHGNLLSDESKSPKKSEELNIYESILEHLQHYLTQEGMENIEIVRGEVDYQDQLLISTGASSHRVNLYTVLEKGVGAHYAIADYAPGHADVVVMATHGRGGLARFFLGSTTEKVTQYLELPVVTVKPPKEKLAKRENR
ncbi:MAG TPA: universal stress protein [Balneolaceae bacterium]